MKNNHISKVKKGGQVIKLHIFAHLFSVCWSMRELESPIKFTFHLL